MTFEPSGANQAVASARENLATAISWLAQGNGHA